jgi:outer membrane protein TolC
MPAAQKAASQVVISDADPRTQIQILVDRALARSQSVGMVKLLAQAARDDWEEVSKANNPRASLDMQGNHIGSSTDGVVGGSGLQGRVGLSVSTTLFDFGRNRQLAGWRSQLAEAARQGYFNAEHQLSLQTVSLALDRGRYLLQAQVYSQYVRRMACLVDSLELIVKADKGRASELVQAQKNLLQADLAVEATMSALRQTETRLKRFVGDELPPSASFANLLTRVPELEDMQKDALSAPDVIQLEAQARAQGSYVESVRANARPQVNGIASTSASAGVTRVRDWAVGVSVNVPLMQPGQDASVNAATKRAEAARLQREDALETRRYRIVDVHESATSAFDRARRITEILRNSSQLRTATLQQWQQLGRRSLFDVMGSESDYYSLRIAHVNAIFDGQQAVAMLWSMGRGVMAPLR